MTDQQDTPPAVELLPCPFCAGEAELADVDAAYYVMCSVDGCWANSCVSLWRDRSEAIATWNTRPAERTRRPDDAAGERTLAEHWRILSAGAYTAGDEWAVRYLRDHFTVRAALAQGEAI